MSVARRFRDGTIVVWLSEDEAQAIRTAITLCVALSPEGVPFPEARMMGEITAVLDVALHPKPLRDLLR